MLQARRCVDCVGRADRRQLLLGLLDRPSSASVCTYKVGVA